MSAHLSLSRYIPLEISVSNACECVIRFQADVDRCIRSASHLLSREDNNKEASFVKSRQLQSHRSIIPPSALRDDSLHV